MDDLTVQKNVIENFLKVKAQEIERCAQMLEDNDFNQIEALAKFHNYEIVRKVFQMLMILNNISKEKNILEFATQFDIRGFVKFGNVNMVNPEKMAAFSALLKECEGLNYETVKSFNSKFGILFQFMLSLVRCYDLNLRYAVIIHQIDERRDSQARSRTLPPLQGEEKNKFQNKTKYFEYDFPGLPAKHEIPRKEPRFSKDIRAKYKYTNNLALPDVLMTRAK